MADSSSDFPWFRFYTEAAHDIKFNVIARELFVDYLFVFGAWALLLCAASQSPVRGSLYVTSQKRHSDGDVSAILHCDEELTKRLMAAFIEMEMIDLDDAGAYRIKNWKKRQASSDSSAERTQKYRERKEKAHRNVTVTSQGRHRDVLDVDVDSDIDSEVEVVVAPAQPETGKIESDNESDDDIGSLSPLSAAFVSATGIPELTGGPKRWFDALEEMQKAGVIPEDIVQAVQELDSKPEKYSIIDVRSIVRSAINCMSRRKRAHSPTKTGQEMTGPNGERYVL